MSHVYISYSKHSSAYARSLADHLLAQGFDVWIDQDLIGYDDAWWRTVEQAIEDCAAFVVIMTPETSDSRWVTRELFKAENGGKPMFPILRSGENWPFFSETKYVDATDGKLPPDDFYNRLAAYAPCKVQGENVTTKLPLNKSRIFISYSRQDQEFARQLARDLEAGGVDVWIDLEDIPGGVSWGDAIQEGLDTSDVLLLVVSEASMQSDNVKDEWMYFKNEHSDKPLIPLIWQTARRHFQLHKLNYIDFQAQDYARAYNQLCAALKRNDILINEPSLSEPPVDNPDDLPQSISKAAEPWFSPLDLHRASLFAASADTNIGMHKLEPATPELTPSSMRVDVLNVLPEPFEWIDIPAGQVTLEAYDGKPIGTFDVPTFTIAKYPITYAQYQVFIDAPDGFYNAEWWQDLAASEEHRSQPGDQRWKSANHPRERVSWYDAIAFCRWLSHKTSQVITLPTEMQWQRAAQGDDGHMYPWGNQFDTSRCNTYEAGIGQTTPVTKYPNGASPYGVLDMSGNVWEWCLNTWGDPAKIDLSGDARRVLRGGAWDRARGLARAVCRDAAHPTDRSNNDGFRLVLRPPSQ